MGVVDARIAAPRRPSPRVRVPIGSVGIAGVQTGIYPAETPGGWQLIGRTPIKPFDPRRDQPFLMRPGDSVQFYAIDRVTLAEMERSAAGGGAS
jgi:inhibitor of KinA